MRLKKTRFMSDFPKVEPAVPADVEGDEEFLAWRREFNGSYPEYLVFRQLERMGYVFGVDFLFQANEMGGRSRLGGAVVDFELIYLRIAGRVQGEFWHLQSAAVREHDAIQKLTLEGARWVVVDMLATEVIERTHRIVTLFTQGRMSARARAAGER